MTHTDLIFILVASVVGAAAIDVQAGGRAYRVGWIILGVWVALKLLHVLA